MLNLIKSTFCVGIFTFISRILGYIRDIFIAKYLGASVLNDAFLVAFRLPNFFRQLFAEGALTAAFIPLFSQNMHKYGSEKSLEFASKVVSAMVYFIIPLMIIIEIFMPQIMIFLAPGFIDNIEVFDRAVMLARVMFPYLLFISLVAIFSGMLNSINKFMPGASAPILLNLTMVIALIFWGKNIPDLALAYAVLIAGVIQFIWLLINIKLANFNIKVKKISLHDNQLVFLFRKMLPGIIGAGIIQLNLWIDTVISTLIPKATSYLYFADRIHQFPLAIFATAIGTVLLPSLSISYKNDNLKKSISIVDKAISFTLTITLPAAFALFIISYPIMNILFVRGEFTASDALQSSYALSAYAFGLIAYSIIKIFTSIFFANNDTKTPVKIAFYCVAMNIILNLILMQFFSHVGIAISTSITAWFQLFILLFYLKKFNFYNLNKLLLMHIFKLLTLSIIMLIILYFVKDYTLFIIELGTLVKFIYLGSLVMLGIVIYFSLGLIFKIFSINEFKNIIRNKN